MVLTTVDGHATPIDHILLESCLSDSLIKCEVVDDPNENHSDHRPVICSLGLTRAQTQHENSNGMVKISWKKAISSNLINAYKTELTSKLSKLEIPGPNCSTSDIENYYQEIVEVLRITAASTLPTVEYKHYLKPYWNKVLNDLHNEMTLCRKLWMEHNRPRSATNELYTRYKKAKAIFRSSMRQAYDEYIAKQWNEIDKNLEIDQKFFWILYNRNRSIQKTQQTELKVNGVTVRDVNKIADAWSIHFENVYSDVPDIMFDEQFRMSVQERISFIENGCLSEECEQLSDPVSEEEIECLCAKLKCGKAGSFDGLVYEHLKYGSCELFRHLCALFSLVISKEYIPTDWRKAVLITLYKGKGKPKEDPNSYRGISLFFF